MPDFEITSGSNPRIKRLVRLRERRHRDAEEEFLVEGTRLVERAVAAGMTPTEVYLDRSVGYSGPGPVVTTHPDALARASYRSHPQGIIAVFPQFPTNLDNVATSDPSLVVVTETIEKPGNLGAMLRTADAVGADAVVVTGHGVDPFNPNVVRASQGALFSVSLALASLEELGPWIQDRGMALIAATPDSPTSMWEADFTVGVAILIGAEDRGLTPEAMAMASHFVSIPMRGEADSLNASVSLAVIAYEVLRQRRR